jgi:tetratricopeptide (TPR) repeat protein
MHEQAWQLCEGLWGVFLHRKHFGQWISAHLVGLASAQACGDLPAQSRMRVQLGLAFRALRRNGEAYEQFLAALALARKSEHPLSEATALEQVSLVDLAEGRAEDAIAGFTAARVIHQLRGHQRGVALAGRHIGEALRDLGSYDQALQALDESRLQFATLPDRYQEARTLTIAGQTSLLADRQADAVQSLTQALSIMTSLGSRYEQARINRFLATASVRGGDLSAAREYLGRALSGFEDAGAPEADEVRHELAISPDGDPR